MTKQELQLIKELLHALRAKCKTDALYNSANRGIEIIDREINNEQ